VGLVDDIGPGPVGLDTVPFIYLIEEHPSFLPLVEPLFVAIDTGRLPAFTSSLTLPEVLVVPYRDANLPLADRYEQILTASRGLHVVDLDRAQLRAAARLRVAYPTLRSPDAIQVAAALTGGCSAFVTNDRRIPTLPGLRILQLGRYLKEHRTK
jgi:predicted nucleic acid-binding protein